MVVVVIAVPVVPVPKTTSWVETTLFVVEDHVPHRSCPPSQLCWLLPFPVVKDTTN